MNDENDNRAYTTRHIWALPTESNHTAYVGLTDFLTEELDLLMNSTQYQRHLDML